MSDSSTLRSRTDGLSPLERRRFRRRIAGADRIDDRDRRARVLDRIEADLTTAEHVLEERRRSVPESIGYPEELPITAHRDALLDAIQTHQVVIVAGETGSGKSTQLPKLCLELGRGVDGMIGHTQPRRLAARSIATRLAEELSVPYGDVVGSTVRFSDRTSDRTLVKVMTDGILLTEIHHDRLLERYDTVIIDEAHERSLDIDFLLGYLRSILPRRPDLKLIVTSATIDTRRFSEFFSNAPVIEVSGRGHPVEIRYWPLDEPNPRDQTEGICDALMELASEGPGDVLVFCSGEREIRDAAEAVADLKLSHTEVLPLYSRLPEAEQRKVFQPHPGRRVVLATNVAETSLTVPGIRYVIDPGAARVSRYGRRSKVQRLPIEPISQASADQRAGRCGRLGPGICIRLYSADDYEARVEFTEPEILRTNLASVILRMAALDLGDIEEFPFLDPPDAHAIKDGLALLDELGAVDGGRGRLRLTAVGRKLAQLPIDVRLGRMVVEADRLGCLREMLVVASALSIQDPRVRPPGSEAKADALHGRFTEPDSDLLGWLRLWEYLHEERRLRSGNQFRKLCREEFLDYRRIREWQDVHTQLRRLVNDLGLTVNRDPASSEQIHRASLAGLLSNIGTKDPDGHEYRGTRGIRFAIFPGSALFRRNPEWIVAGELVETSRLWARSVAPVDPRWIEEAAAALVHRTHSDPWWDPERGAAMTTETVSLFGLQLASGRQILAHRVDPEAARELFIRHALVAGEWDAPHAFVGRNRDRWAELADLEARFRRQDLFVGDDALVAHFDARIPADVVSTRHFDAWWKDARSEKPDLLDLALEDLLDPSIGPLDADAYPEQWVHGDVAVPLRYELDPGTDSDGVVAEIPTSLLDRVDAGALQWNVPGLRAELLDSLVRSLPKRLRKLLHPIPNTVTELVERIDPSEGDLLATVRRELTRMCGEPIPADALDLDRIPAHLRMRIRVVDDEGTVLAEGDDPAKIKSDLASRTRREVAATTHPIERDGLTAWDLGELPRRIEIGDPVTPAYPALVDRGDSVSVRVLATLAEQADAMWDGTRRLLLLGLATPRKILQPLVDRTTRRLLSFGPYESPSAWIDDCVASAVDSLLFEAGGPAWDATSFDELRRHVRDGVGQRAIDVAAVSLDVHRRLEELGRVVGRLPETFSGAVADVTRQVNRLVFDGFATDSGASRLPDIERYLRAAIYRVERVPERPDRDAELVARIRALEDEHERLVDALGTTDELYEIGWMLEELRVSLFAQPIGVRGKVSEKRIGEALRDALLA
jgi:ATP-dependent helicase HrpA